MSFNEWKAYRLGDIVLSANTGLDAIKRAPIVQENTGIKCLRIQDISQNKSFSNWGFCAVNETNFQKFQLKKDDLIIARTGETVGVNRIIKENLNAVFNNGLIRIRVNEDKFIPKFVYYSFQSNIFRNHIIAIAHGTSTQPNMRIEALLDYNIEIPNKETQTRISSILSRIDDAIEVNQQTNQTLEEIAKTLFKEWFVNFNYPNATDEMQSTEMGDVPVGWKEENIGDWFDFVIGGDWGKDNEESTFSNYCTVIRGTDIPSILNSNLKSIPKRFVQESKLKNRRLRDGDIVFEISGGSKDQATGRNILITKEILDLFDTEVIPASFCRLIRTKNIKTGYFLGIYLNYFYSGGGTWHYQLQSTGISNFQFQVFTSDHKIVAPPDELINSFFELVQPIIKQIGENISENQTLFALRDTLLPKLMKGEIEING